MLVLSPDASRAAAPLDARRTTQHLNDADLDLGSTSPAFLPGGYAVQGGKDGMLRLLQLHRLPGRERHAPAASCRRCRRPGEPTSSREPAVWKGKWVFVATSAGTEALLFTGGRLHPVWSNTTGGTSPVVAGYLLYVAGAGAVHVYVPTSGREVAQLPTGDVHWQSPIVADGRVAVAEGNANDHATTGVLDIFRSAVASSRGACAPAGPASRARRR